MNISKKALVNALKTEKKLFLSEKELEQLGIGTTSHLWPG